MATYTVPDRAELVQRMNKTWAIQFPSVRSTGGRKLGSFSLGHKDKKTARAEFDKWVEDGGFERAQAADFELHLQYVAKQKAAGRQVVETRPDWSRVKHKGETSQVNGHGGAHGKTNLPALIPEKPRRAANGAAKDVKSDLSAMTVKQARTQLKMLSAQLAAIALNVQMLGDSLGMPSDDE